MSNRSTLWYTLEELPPLRERWRRCSALTRKGRKKLEIFWGHSFLDFWAIGSKFVHVMHCGPSVWSCGPETLTLWPIPEVKPGFPDGQGLVVLGTRNLIWITQEKSWSDFKNLQGRGKFLTQIWTLGSQTDPKSDSVNFERTFWCLQFFQKKNEKTSLPEIL